MDNQKAFNWVEDFFRDTIPTGIPLPYKNIVEAKFVKAGFPTVHATLEMLDEDDLKIEVSKLPLLSTGRLSWKYKWLSGKGYIYWDNEKKEWLKDIIEC